MWVAGARVKDPRPAPLSSEELLASVRRILAAHTGYGDAAVPRFMWLEFDAHAEVRCRRSGLLGHLRPKARCGHHHFRVHYLCERDDGLAGGLIKVQLEREDMQTLWLCSERAARPR